MLICKIEECNKKVHSKGYCQPHYRRARRRGEGESVTTHQKPGPKPKVSLIKRVRKTQTETHCIRSHEFTPENTYTYPNGKRVCKICRRNSQRKALGKTDLGDAPVGLWNANKTHCVNGHELSGDNLRIRSDGSRRCITCERLVSWTNSIKNNYGITPEQYDQMFTAQAGLCAICKSSNDEEKLHVDHCHDSNIVRGLLCNNCNNGLGRFKDSIEALETAVSYLKQYSCDK